MSGRYLFILANAWAQISAVNGVAYVVFSSVVNGIEATES